MSCFGNSDINIFVCLCKQKKQQTVRAGSEQCVGDECMLWMSLPEFIKKKPSILVDLLGASDPKLYPTFQPLTIHKVYLVNYNITINTYLYT